jgi:hypothetical protein
MRRARGLAIMMAAGLLLTGAVAATGPTRWQAAETGKAAHLTKKHTGWRKTQCLDCHQAATLAPRHKSGLLKPAECGPCHGYNGAPHEDHAIPINACGSCHTLVEHASRFEAPGECIKCHHHPANPRGK